MNRILIAYSTNTGNTKICAELLHEKLKESDIVNLVDSTPNINNYDLIIIGGNVRVGRINKLTTNFIKANYSGLINKKTAYFVSSADVNDADKFFKESISSDLLDKAIVYQSFGGSMDPEKLRGFWKVIFKIAIKSMKEENKPKIQYDLIDEFVKKVK